MAQDLVPAAKYLRMSTERQHYSFSNQIDVIEKFATHHGFGVVKTYSDEAKSGLSFRKRKGLQMLIEDVVGGAASYRAILVYDVSRWGRFQDIDEAAHYEFLCKAAGIPVHYCAEPFSNDSGMPNLIMKSLKRVMAGEYSRELGIKVLAGQKRLASLGFKQGGQPGYGLRRLLVSADRTPKQYLAPGERKCLADDRVVLIPGPPEEVAVVREIYRLFLEKNLSFRAIAAELDRQGIPYPNKLTWCRRAIRDILTNPKYAGTNVFGRSSMRLFTPKLDVPRSEWILCPRAFDSVIDSSTYEHVQRVLATYTRNKTNDQLLDDLRTLIVDQKLEPNKNTVDITPGVASSTTYRTRFGSLGRAFALIGHQCHPSEDWLQKFRNIKSIRRKLMEDIVLASAGQVSIGYRADRRFQPCLCMKKSGRQVAVVIARHHLEYKLHPRWRIRPLLHERGLITLVARLSETNEALWDFFVIPPFGKSKYVRVCREMTPA